MWLASIGVALFREVVATGLGSNVEADLDLGSDVLVWAKWIVTLFFVAVVDDVVVELVTGVAS